jgi:3-methylcrotonyl-CoA carboxylase alpha subunit
MSFDTLLIANRGEIACRVIRTAKALGLRTVAVYSEADAGALHAGLADEAVLIGPPPAAESYLKAAAILAAAEASGAQAVHPGYGFLSENADFAEACAGAGLVFVGPPPVAIRAMGAKDRAKTIMEEAGVPLVPGYHGEDQAADVLAEAAGAIGYPVMIKAVAGGGGKGMRLVEDPDGFADALAGARREAAAAFGDERVLVEKYLARPRHVEIQVFADRHGNAVHLFERDCSIQRRHQKVVEEAPAPGLGPARREEMGAAAVRAAKAIGYEGAGTVEFLYQDESFYFMEMNTRLQVEHPVTEMITGQDLVAWQLGVAAGEPLPLGQDGLRLSGHAIEARLYAEDPAREYLPSPGRLRRLRFPAPDRHVRVDSGVRSGDQISHHYDPMIAKLVVWDEDRPAAVDRLRRALAEVRAEGVTTNLAFLAAIAANPAFAAGEVDTGFVPRHAEALIPGEGPASDEVLALASLAELLRRRQEAANRADRSEDPHSPWHQSAGWRLNMEARGRLVFRDGEREVSVGVGYAPRGFVLELPGGEVRARAEGGAGGALQAELDGRPVHATVVRGAGELTVIAGGACHRLGLPNPLAEPSPGEAGAGHLMAPMPGKVVEVRVAPGQRVRRGAPLMLLEAMKMEHTITAPVNGTVAAVHFAAGDLVEEGVDLLDIEPGEG